MATASEIALAAIKSELDGGRMFWFAGPVPADENAALDMDAQHTQLVEMTVDGNGFTGLTFSAPAGNAMVKDPNETWTGLVAFDGAQSSETSLTASFYRFCAAGDDGRGKGGATPRLQGTIGPAGTDIPMVSAVLTANGSNTQGLSYFAVIEQAS